MSVCVTNRSSWLDFADFDRSEVEMRAIPGQLDDLVVAAGLDDKQPAHHFARFGVGAVGDLQPATVTAEDAALFVVELVADDRASILLHLGAPGDVALDDRLHLGR